MSVLTISHIWDDTRVHDIVEWALLTLLGFSEKEPAGGTFEGFRQHQDFQVSNSSRPIFDT
jgi:hypothetical protein